MPRAVVCRRFCEIYSSPWYHYYVGIRHGSLGNIIKFNGCFILGSFRRGYCENARKFHELTSRGRDLRQPAYDYGSIAPLLSSFSLRLTLFDTLGRRCRFVTVSMHATTDICGEAGFFKRGPKSKNNESYDRNKLLVECSRTKSHFN